MTTNKKTDPTPAEIFAKSSTLCEAADRTIALCVEHRITDPATMMEIMDRTVRIVHARLVDTLQERHAEIVDAVLRTIWTEIRTEAGLPVD